MEWSKKWRIIYGLSFAAAVVLLAAYPVYLVTHPVPTCSDQKQNGAETGVDCGGGCTLQCVAEMKTPRVLWAKAFYLGGPYYDLGAFVENPNARAGVKSARYAFQVFDKEGKLIVEKKGATEIAPGVGFALFEPNIAISGTPDHTEVVFEPSDLSRWVKARVSPSIVVPKNQTLKNVDTKPRLEATLMNTDFVNNVANLTVNAIIYNTSRIPVAVSRTFVDAIQKGGEQDIFFTWPRRFTEDSNDGAESFITDIVVTPRAMFVI